MVANPDFGDYLRITFFWAHSTVAEASARAEKVVVVGILVVVESLSVVV